MPKGLTNMLHKNAHKDMHHSSFDDCTCQKMNVTLHTPFTYVHVPMESIFDSRRDCNFCSSRIWAIPLPFLWIVANNPISYGFTTISMCHVFNTTIIFSQEDTITASPYHSSRLGLTVTTWGKLHIAELWLRNLSTHLSKVGTRKH